MNGKLKAIALLGILYVVGVISGVAWQRYRIQQWPKHPELYGQRRVDRLKKKLDLTPAQETAIKEIFQKAHDKTLHVNEEVSWNMAMIHRESVQEIRKVLTPEQLVKFEQLHDRYHSRHKNVPQDNQERPVASTGKK